MIGTMFSRGARAASGVVAALLVVESFSACETGAPPIEGTERTASALWTNGDFETGAANMAPPAPWVVATFLNPGITVQSPQTLAGLNLGAGGAARTVT